MMSTRTKPLIASVASLLLVGAMAIAYAALSDRFGAPTAARTVPRTPMTFIVGQNSLLRPLLVGPTGSVQFAYYSDVDGTGNLSVTLVPNADMLADTEYSLRGTVVETLAGVGAEDCAAFAPQRNKEYEFDGRKCVRLTKRAISFRTSKA